MLTHITLLASLILPSQTIRGGHGVGVSVGIRGGGQQTVQSSPFTFGMTPDCESGGDWFVCCKPSVDVVCGDGYEWGCWEADGTSIAITNRCADGVEDGPVVDSAGTQQKVMKDIDGTSGGVPQMDNPIPDNLGLSDIWDDSHTFIALVHQDTAGGAQVAFSHRQSASTGVRFGNEGGAVECEWFGVTDVILNEADAPNGTYGVMSCRKDGTTFTARNTGNFTNVTDSSTIVIPANRVARYGQGPNGTVGYGWAIIYDRALSDDEIATIERQTMGLASSPDSVTWVRDSDAYLEGEDGKIYGLTFDSTFAQPDGVEIWEETTNNWTFSNVASVAIAVGTPIITNDTDEGPWSKWYRGDEADTVEDNDGAAFEGIESPGDTSLTDGDYTCSAYMASGTETGYTIDLLKDGVSMGSCSANDLTSTFTLKLCTQNTSGAPVTDVACQIVVGDSAADTGTIKLVGMHFSQASRQQRICRAGGSSTTCNKDIVSVPTTGWPVSAGTLEFSFTPLITVFASQRFIFFRDPEGIAVATASLDRIQVDSKGPGGTTTTLSSTLSWAVGTTYNIKVEWTAAGAVNIFRDMVLVGSGTGKEVPTSIPATAYIGSNGSNQQINGRIANVRVYK